MPAPTKTNQQVIATMRNPQKEPLLTLQFLSNAKHRNRPTHNASIWSITFEEEYYCFESSDIDPAIGIRWGHRNRSPLGWSIRTKNPRLDPDLIYAKFVFDHNNVWHGYPADYLINIHDIPYDDFLQLSLGLNKAQIKRIKTGKSL